MSERDPLNQELDDLRAANAKLNAMLEKQCALLREAETKLEATKDLAIKAIGLIKF